MQANIWSVYNQTIANMNESANGQYYTSVSEINAIQAGSVAPSDMGAYNLTMYGMDSIHDIQSMVVGSMSQLKELSDSALRGQATTSGTAAGSVYSDAAQGACVADLVANATGGMIPVHDILYALLFVVLGIAIGATVREIMIYRSKTS